MSESRLVDIEPGGESSQYESIRTVTQSPSKQTGQLAGGSAHTKSETNSSLEATDDSKEKPANDEENLAQKLGKGGQTTDAAATSGKDMKSNAQDGGATPAKTRRQQGYGPGSGVGA